MQCASEDRWPTSGSSPGSDGVGSDSNLLGSMLPTAAQDNMFRPLREHAETGSSAVASLLKRCRDCNATLVRDAFLSQITASSETGSIFQNRGNISSLIF